MKKKFIGAVLALCLVSAFMPCIHAAEITDSGSCGDNLTWTLDSEGTLTVSGSGEILEFDCSNDTLHFNKAVIENGVTGIGKLSFSECYDMTSIEISGSVTKIDKTAFLGCENLTNITVASSNNTYCSQNGNLFSKDKKTLIQYAIGKTDKSYTVPEGIMYINDFSFARCKAIEEIILPEGISKINSHAFGDCVNLTQINLPDSITQIGAGAFAECQSLKKVTLPKNVSTIEEQAFYDCESLSEIAIDLNNRNYCSQNGNLFSKDKKTLIQYAIGKKDTSYIIPQSVKHIDKYAFLGSTLENITIPFGVVSIGEDAFAMCNGLKKLSLPNSITQIGDGAFRECYCLTSITLPNGITNINKFTFYSCESLKKVRIPDGTTGIDRFAFEGCYDLTEMTLPDSITSISNSAFSICESLTDVYYAGTMEQWNKIKIGEYNDTLLNANIHYNTSNKPLKTNVTKEIDTNKNQVIFNITALEEDRADELNDISLFAAEYDENGLLTNLTMGTKSELSDNRININAPIPSSENYKFMLWDDLSRPITEAITDIDN